MRLQSRVIAEQQMLDQDEDLDECGGWFYDKATDTEWGCTRIKGHRGLHAWFEGPLFYRGRDA